MLICIDSCVFIKGINLGQSEDGRLLEQISLGVQVAIPRLVVREVTRNLDGKAQLLAFHRLFYKNSDAMIIDAPIPPRLISRYISLGLAEKGDAIIGAFAEWMEVEYLISDNRHFLRRLKTDAYRIVSSGEFLQIRGELDAP